MSASPVILLMRSLLAMIAALAVLVVGVWLSGEVASWLDLPIGGDARLAWDLGGTLVPAWAAFVVVARLAPRAPRWHVLALWLLLMGVAAWGVWTLGADYPVWFSAALLLCLPLAAWWVARRNRGGR